MEQICENCGKALIRFNANGKVYCNSCDYLLTKPVDNFSNDIYVKCPSCGYEGEELINAVYSTLCPKCKNPVLHQ